jgi:predicted dehydrogenase
MNGRRRIALVGVGSMGANHARVIAESDAADLAVIIDTDTERVAPLAERLGCAYAQDLEAARDCDGVIVATPTRLHAGQAAVLMELSKALLVEKPIAPTVAETRAVIAESRRRGVPLMCGFVERFNPAVTTVVQLLDDLPVHVLGLRHSPATPRSTLSVVLDLLIHEIDLALLYNRGCKPDRVSSALSSARTDAVTEIADCMLHFESGGVATLSASRASQRKLRTHLIATPTALYDVDLLRQDVTVYRHRSHSQEAEASVSYRAETVVDIPFVRHRGEPLALQLHHFLDLVDGKVDVDAERDSILPAHEVAACVELDVSSPGLRSTPSAERVMSY